MATFSGKDGIVKLGSDAVAEITSFNIEQTSATRRTTAMGDVWETSEPELKSWSGDINCHWDDTDTTGQEALSVGSKLTVSLYPEGDATGAYELQGDVIVTSVSQSNNFDNTNVVRTFTFQGNGPLTIGTA